MSASTRCGECLGLFFSLNLCPIGLFDRHTDIPPEEQIGDIIEGFVLFAVLYHWLMIASMFFGFLFYRTTRSFCLVMCIMISCVMCNHLNNSMRIPRPSRRLE